MDGSNTVGWHADDESLFQGTGRTKMARKRVENGRKRGREDARGGLKMVDVFFSVD